MAGMIKHVHVKYHLFVRGVPPLRKHDGFFTVRVLEAEWVRGRRERNHGNKLPGCELKEKMVTLR